MKYFWEIIKHKWFIIVSGIRVGGIPLYRLLLHDWSKFSPTEFSAYKKKYITKNCSEEEWKNAFNHHLHRNLHHWQYWIFKKDPLPIPEVYVREMVADWLAAGRSYAGSCNIESWVKENYPKMNLHSKTKNILKRILKEQNIQI